MQKIRKFIALFAATLFCFSFGALAVGCGGDKPQSENSVTSEVVSEEASASESVSETVSETVSEPETSEVEDEAWANVDISSSYAVRVLYPDGTPVQGVKVQVCIGASCNIPPATDENGIASPLYTPNRQVESAEIKLLRLPDGYTYPQGLSTSATAYEKIVITLIAE